MAEETTPTNAGEQTPGAETPDANAVAEAAATAQSGAELTKKAPKAESADGDKPAAKAKKEKAPALEDKPFADFVQQDYLPALKKGLAQQGIENAELTFEKQPILVSGMGNAPECWQVIGRWNSGWKQPRQFNIYFLKDDIQGPKAFSYSESGSKPSTLESFLIDERKVNLGLLVFGAVQRLNAQKWLIRN